MANLYGVNEWAMHSQRDPNMAGIKLGSSHVDMYHCGCVVTGCAYLASRVLGRDVQPLELLNWLNKNSGFNSLGELRWEKLSEFVKQHGSSLTMFATNPIFSFGKKFTARWVKYGMIDHFVIEMTNHVNATPVCYDPYAWPASGDPFVKPIAFFKNGTLLGRNYFK